jgi:hypothetical protein
MGRGGKREKPLIWKSESSGQCILNCTLSFSSILQAYFKKKNKERKNASQVTSNKFKYSTEILLKLKKCSTVVIQVYIRGWT